MSSVGWRRFVSVAGWGSRCWSNGSEALSPANPLVADRHRKMRYAHTLRRNQDRKDSIVNRKSLPLTLVAIVASILVFNFAGLAQTKSNRSTSAAETLSYLPASDGVMLIDVRRLLTETFPRVFAGDTAKLAQVNSEIDKFKTQTGIDPRSLNRVVVGTRYVYPSPSVTKIETVVLAHG